jgi:RHS repeat-associated protein
MPDTNFLYFYHPDHISSTSYVTDVDGELYEHMQYFPSGEPWVDQRSNTERLPHLFSSKELDQETGLYYFGARYYDARTGMWQSTDPILDTYLPSGNEEHDRKLPGLGGVFNTPNLNLYNYSRQNPVNFVDPTGQEIRANRWKDASGVWQTRITFTAVLVNNSKVPMTAAQLDAHAKTIEAAIERAYTKRWANGAENVVTKATIYTAPPPKGAAALHEIRFQDTIGGNPQYLGSAEFGKKQINLNVGLVTGAFSGVKNASLERTAAHEFGHSAWLQHPGEAGNPLKLPDENLMSQTWKSKSTNVQFNQIILMYDMYRNGMLNKP